MQYAIIIKYAILHDKCVKIIYYSLQLAKRMKFYEQKEYKNMKYINELHNR